MSMNLITWEINVFRYENGGNDVFRKDNEEKSLVYVKFINNTNEQQTIEVPGGQLALIQQLEFDSRGINDSRDNTVYNIKWNSNTNVGGTITALFALKKIK